MKDLSFIAPIVDRHWFGLTTRPSLTGKVTCVARIDDSVGNLIMWIVYFGHVEWRVKPAHPADRWLLDVAARHSS